ncbi:MAG: hypothetical protein NVS3B2_16390 [Ramlibacter sp.]
MTALAILLTLSAMAATADDPHFKKLLDGVIAGMMKSGGFDRRCTKWCMSPIPPDNVNLRLPMAQQLRDSLKNRSDKPAL